MGRKHLLPIEHDEYLERIGLTDIDKKVYIATLDSGLVSVGEIQQLTKINDLSFIVESIRDLIDIGLIKKAQGRMPRYYAILPFMRETITIEKEFSLALDAMITSINQSKSKISDRREELVSIEFPNFIQELLDAYYHDILAPTLKEYEKLNEDLNENSFNQIREIQNYNVAIKEEIALMIKPIVQYAKSMSESFDNIINKSDLALNDYLSNIKKNNETILQNVFTSIKDHMAKLGSSTKEFGKNVIDSIAEINSLETKFGKIQTDLNRINPGLNQLNTSVRDIQNELKSELISAREKLFTTGKEINDTDKLEFSKNEINEIFNSLISKVDKLDFNSEETIAIVDIGIKTVSDAQTSLNEAYQKLLIDNTSRASKFNNIMNELGKDISDTLTKINSIDTEALNKLEVSIKEEIVGVANKIKNEGDRINLLVKEHFEGILDNFDMISNNWEKNMANHFDKPSKIILPVINDWVDNITPVIDNFKKQTDGMFARIVAPLIEFENQSIGTLIERTRFVKVMVEGRSADLSSIIEFAKSFDYTKSSDTWVVVGLPSTYASLTDMILRTRVKVTIVIPNIDLELVEIIRKIRSTIRITFVTDIDPQTDARFISKMKETGRVVLRSYDKKDLYACIRDSEEIILGYKSDEEMVAIRSSTPSIVQLLEDRLNETVIRNSKNI